MVEEAVVTRRVTVLGQPFVNTVMFGMPANRVFRVIDGGVLDLRFVVMRFGYPGIITEYIVVEEGGAILIQGGQGKVGKNFMASHFFTCSDSSIIISSLQTW